MQKSLISILVFTFILHCTLAEVYDEPSENLSNGSKVKASSHYKNYLPDLCIDGIISTKGSRWLSDESKGPHWLELDLGSEKTFNRIEYFFWKSTHIATEFEIQVEKDGKWKTIEKVTPESIKISNAHFPCVSITVVFSYTTSRKIRTVFYKAIPDTMLRLNEIKIHKTSEAIQVMPIKEISGGILLSRDPVLLIKKYDNKELSLKSEIKLLKTNKETQLIKSKIVPFNMSKSKTNRIKLPVPDEYGIYEYDIKILNSNNKTIWTENIKFCHLPENSKSYMSSLPFGCHFTGTTEESRKFLGISWLRTMDRFRFNWRSIDDEKEILRWKKVEEYLKEAKRGGYAICTPLNGAPDRFSTAIPGDQIGWDTTSFYPPSDFNAWLERYVLPYAEKSMLTVSDRAYELWNEAWSYYRWRGMRGTPGELLIFFRKTYQALKAKDPKSIVYPTDVRLAGKDRYDKYAYAGFDRDMLELGYLRFADLTSYHFYGVPSFDVIERIRRKAWNFGRDLALWNTETAQHPPNKMMEYMVQRKAFGLDKMFLFNLPNHAPFFIGDKISMNLPGHTALLRNLRDALYLGQKDGQGYRAYYFSGGKNFIAVLFTDSEKVFHPEIPINSCSVVSDVFGNIISNGNITLEADRPVFIHNPSEKTISGAICNEIKKRSKWMSTQSLIRLCSGFELPVSLKELDTKFEKLEATLRKKRMESNNGEFFYDSNFVLDIINNYKIGRARRSGAKLNAPDMETMDKKLKKFWTDAHEKSNWSGCFMNAERMGSRAQKQIQWAYAYHKDNDRTARDYMLKIAKFNLDIAVALLKKEQVSNIYKPKIFFRTRKYILRSDEYHFVAGSLQKIFITVANPLGKKLSGTLEIELPTDWKCSNKLIEYSVEPLSRQVLDMEITVPSDFISGELYFINIKDSQNKMKPVSSLCYIVKELPLAPLMEAGFSKGELPGN